MPPTGMTSYTYALDENGFILNTDDQDFPFFDVTEIKGLDSSPIRMNTNERESIDGTYINANHVSMRTVVITGIAYTNPTDPDTLLDTLRRAYTSPLIRKFYFQHPGKSLRFLNAQGGGVQYNIDTNRRLGITPVQLTLLCADPYVYDYPASSGTTTLNATGAGTVINSNPFFSTTVTPWTGVNGATLAQVSTPAFGTATGAMQLTPNGTTAFPQGNTEFCAASPGESYTMLAEGYSASAWASGIAAGVSFYDSTHTLIRSFFSSATALLATTWAAVGVSGTAPANTAFVVGSVQVQGTPTAAQLFDWDSATLIADAGIAFPLGFNFGFGVLAPNAQVTVQNQGTHTAYPVITLNGPLTTPIVVDQLNNIIMTLNLTLGASDQLVIDCNKKSIVLNGTGNWRSAYSGILWPTVPSGLSDTFQLAGIGTGSMTVQLYNTYY